MGKFANEDPRIKQMRKISASAEANKSKTRPLAKKGTKTVLKAVVASRTAKTTEERNKADYNAIRGLRQMRLNGAALNLSDKKMQNKISKRVAQSKKAKGK